jgi:YgiT-type zinc finger domain-containing protein
LGRDVREADTETIAMKGIICWHGETRPGTTTVTLERGALTLVVKQVPARVCDTCGEQYIEIEEEAATRLLQTVEEAASAGVLVDVRAYAA